MHWLPLQKVPAWQGEQEAPQALFVSQATQLLAWHRFPGPHWLSIVHSTQRPLLHFFPEAAQFSQEAPQR